MTWHISVPFTEMELTCDGLEMILESSHGNTKIETIINSMFEQGYNMDIFFSDYDFETNQSKNASIQVTN